MLAWNLRGFMPLIQGFPSQREEEDTDNQVPLHHFATKNGNLSKNANSQ